VSLFISQARSHAARRAMTLIELILAVAIASLVLLTALGLLTSIQRSEAMLARRANETASLHRMRLVMQRSFSSMLVSQVTAPAPGNAVARPVEVDGVSASVSPEVPLVPPRIILELDPAQDGVILRQVRPDGTILEMPPQRLEMVLADPPVANVEIDPFAIARAIKKDTRRLGIAERERLLNEGRAGESGTTSPVSNGASDTLGIDEPSEVDGEGGDEEESVRAVRGVFELRRQEVVTAASLAAQRNGTPLPQDSSVDEKPVYELWWVPLAARRTVEEVRELSRTQRRIEAVSAGDPQRIASDITFLRVRMFDDRAKKMAYSATYQKELPAYVEVDVETRSGLRGEWLFEVGWVLGPETGRQAEIARQRRTAQAANQAGSQSAGQSSRPGGAGGPGGIGAGAGGVGGEAKPSGSGKSSNGGKGGGK